MLRVDINEIVAAEVVPWEENEFGVSYVTQGGRQNAERVGPLSEAEAIVRRASMIHDTLRIFPKDVAAS